MIKAHCFTDAWLEKFKTQEEHKRIDKIILEKMIYALHLLERLQSNGLKFVFKGGTSLILLLKEGNRFSIDIDIICNTDRKDLEDILEKVIENSNFSEFELDEHRSYKEGVPKAHYRFKFETERPGSGTILLDILIEDSIYPEVITSPILTKWIEVEGETLIYTPSIDSITGDKLTAFAPNTIGIPYFKGKRRQSFSMEIIKQLFDLSKLFDHVDNLETIAKSFDAFAKHEIEYRNQNDEPQKITQNDVLRDTIDTCIILSKRGGGTTQERERFRQLQQGITAFGTAFLMSGNFRIDHALEASAKVAYLAAKLFVQDYDQLKIYTGQGIGELIIDDPKWNFLMRLKRLPDKSVFFYWYQTVQVLGTEYN